MTSWSKSYRLNIDGLKNIDQTRRYKMTYKLSGAEYRFMEEIWLVEPIKSSALVKLCEEKFGWKKSTTYTVIKNLIKKSVLINEDTVVRSIVTREELAKAEGSDIADKAFNGNMLDMFASFLQDRRLTEEEYLKLEQLINKAYKGE